MVAAAFALRALERRVVADRDHRVLEERAPAVVRVDVPGDDRLDADRLRELPQPSIALRVSALVRPLELDEEPVLPEDRRQLRRAVAVPCRETVPCAAGQADKPFVELREQVPIERGRDRLRRLGPSPGMRRGQQPAQIRVPTRRLDEQCHVRPVRERHLRPGDRPHAERLRRVRELERPVTRRRGRSARAPRSPARQPGRPAPRGGTPRRGRNRLNGSAARRRPRDLPRPWRGRAAFRSAARAPRQVRRRRVRGARVLVRARLRADRAPRPRDHADSFYVLEGEVEFTIGDETKRAGPGTWVAAPAGVRHGFAIPGPEGAHFLNIHAPGSGFIDRIRKD